MKKIKPYAPQDPALGRFLQAHFALLFMPACVNDDNGNAVYWNPHAERVSGLSAHDALGTASHPRLLSFLKNTPAPEEDPLLLFLSGNLKELESRYGREHLIPQGQDGIAILDCPAGTTGGRLLLCGRQADAEGKKTFSYLAWMPLELFNFTVSPSLNLFQLLKGLDRTRELWFSVNQDELHLYLSQPLIDEVYAQDIRQEECVGLPLAQGLTPAAALDHARTIAGLSPEGGAPQLCWPHQNMEQETIWTSSWPNIIMVNGRKANFSLVRDITTEKKRDFALEGVLASHSVRRKQAQDLLTMFAGYSPIMIRTMETMFRAALSLVTVSIHGETGTGKSLAARLIHHVGPRADGPFVSVNCGAVPEELFESSFFGHVKGAFTGAVADKNGFLTEADDGTLFLDEIAELSPRSQARLLLALSEKSYTPVGADRPRSSKFRLIVATNRNLETLVSKGLFREDLFYRVNVLDIHLPPLRERKEDLPLLIDNILRRDAISQTLSKADLQKLRAHCWPGNIRELENVIQRFAAEHSLDFFRPVQGCAAPSGKAPAEDLSLRERLSAAERDILHQALERCHWNRTRTAQTLGITRMTLFRKMREHGIAENS